MYEFQKFGVAGTAFVVGTSGSFLRVLPAAAVMTARHSAHAPWAVDAIAQPRKRRTAAIDASVDRGFI